MEYSYTSILRRMKFFLLTALVAAALLGCEGDQGPKGDKGEPGVSPQTTTPSAESLNITINSVTISSPPVVELSVSDENGIPFTGISDEDLRFTFAKLVPAMNGDPSYWQSYINKEETATVGPGTGNTAVQATSERDGTLVNNGDGTYSYTFATDVANVTTPLAVSYEPDLTHRVAIQVGGGLPVTNPTFTFRPSDGATTGIVTRNIVKIESCNECHNTLALHGGGRVDTLLCVTCHNPGSTDANSGNTVDFKVMIHKIHRGEDLPSVVAGGEYSIYGYRDTKHDYSDVVLPQNIRNCSKCHDGSDPDTPEGDNWKTQLSMNACGSCHDDIDFSKDGSGTPPVDPSGHPGGIVSDNTECITCHATGRIARSVEEAHILAESVARTKFKFNIDGVTGGTTPSIQISVTDPTNSDTPYDLTADEFTGGGARLAVIIGWGMTDFNNTGGATNTGFPNFQATAAMPISIDPVAACGAGIADWTCTPNTPTAGIYTLTKLTTLPAAATGTGRVGFEGHVAADFDGDLSFDDEVATKSVVKDFVITGTLTSRREVVDIAKCDNCHAFLSLHGGNRNDEPALCVICHNPNATDTGRRPALVADTTDGKVEEALDFKTLIHGIHAGAQTNYDSSEAHGHREKGLVVWGFPGAPCDQFGGPPGNSCEHDFSDVRFPGILQDCETCHKPDTYILDDDWASPTANDILSTTVTTSPDNTVPDDDLNISPTAAVCSSCHDSDVAKAHMKVPGGAVFDQTQGVITSTIVETCSVCHGPGRDTDVEKVHTAR
jgi:OmcA/MtrC family decaheme c-type cytochrome